jgi:hypothetical protein
MVSLPPADAAHVPPGAAVDEIGIQSPIVRISADAPARSSAPAVRAVVAVATRAGSGKVVEVHVIENPWSIVVVVVVISPLSRSSSHGLDDHIVIGIVTVPSESAIVLPELHEAGAIAPSDSGVAAPAREAAGAKVIAIAVALVANGGGADEVGRGGPSSSALRTVDDDDADAVDVVLAADCTFLAKESAVRSEEVA